MGGLEKSIRDWSQQEMACRSQSARGRGMEGSISWEGRAPFQEDSKSVSHGKERKPQQLSPTSAWATPRSVLTCTAYVCLVTPSVLGIGLPETIEHFLFHCPRFHNYHTAPRSRTRIL
ncbi:hypothetical protein E2C01_056507 [Portunus trituberculatus]|uniref:Uncharacterized protein n=1 Tax=Portunus trituberculatus TaxID=210409 RepID=A0A5B7GUB6_PORTR|nr:hypothetical protein [Portunus trituberculatus]